MYAKFLGSENVLKFPGKFYKPIIKMCLKQKMPDL